MNRVVNNLMIPSIIVYIYRDVSKRGYFRSEFVKAGVVLSFFFSQSVSQRLSLRVGVDVGMKRKKRGVMVAVVIVEVCGKGREYLSRS